MRRGSAFWGGSGRSFPLKKVSTANVADTMAAVAETTAAMLPIHVAVVDIIIKNISNYILNVM